MVSLEFARVGGKQPRGIYAPDIIVYIYLLLVFLSFSDSDSYCR
jgi:hypothetical protein